MPRVPTRRRCYLQGHEGAVLAVRLSKSGDYCVSAGYDRTVRLWNPHRETEIKVYKGHMREALDVRVFDDSSRIVSCGADKQAIIWDVSTGRPMRRFRGHTQRVNAVAINAEGTVAFTAGFDQAIRVWDLRAHNQEALQTISGFRDSVSSVQVTSNAIISGSVDGCVRIHDIRRGKVFEDSIGIVERLQALENGALRVSNCKIPSLWLNIDGSAIPITSVSMTYDGNCVCVSALDSSVRLLDKSSGELLNMYRGITSTKYKVESIVSNSDAEILCGSEDGQIVAWDMVEGNVLQAWKGHTSVVCSLSYHPRACFMVSGSVDGYIGVWSDALE